MPFIVLKINKKEVIYPLPDLTLQYFSIAQTYYNEVIVSKKILFKQLKLSPNINLDSFIKLNSNFYGCAYTYLTNLFSSIESFINYLIPFNYEYQGKNHFQIQKQQDFKTKIKEIIPEITNKSFLSENNDKYSQLLKLKEIRDEFVHPKIIADEQYDFYKSHLEKILNFDYKKAIYVVKDYINFYKPNHIELNN